MNILFINLRYRKEFTRHRTFKDMYTDKRVISSQLLCPATNETIESSRHINGYYHKDCIVKLYLVLGT